MGVVGCLPSDCMLRAACRCKMGACMWDQLPSARTQYQEQEHLKGDTAPRLGWPILTVGMDTLRALPALRVSAQRLVNIDQHEMSRLNASYEHFQRQRTNLAHLSEAEGPFTHYPE